MTPEKELSNGTNGTKNGDVSVKVEEPSTKYV